MWGKRGWSSGQKGRVSCRSRTPEESGLRQHNLLQNHIYHQTWWVFFHLKDKNEKHDQQGHKPIYVLHTTINLTYSEKHTSSPKISTLIHSFYGYHKSKLSVTNYPSIYTLYEIHRKPLGDSTSYPSPFYIPHQ